MRIISIFILLLMTSIPAFAETYVCTFLVPSSSIGFRQEMYTRSGDHFVHREGRNSPVFPSDHTIGYEDELELFLHWTRIDNDRTTFLAQINKNNGNIVSGLLRTEGGLSGVFEGTCVVVE